MQRAVGVLEDHLHAAPERFGARARQGRPSPIKATEPDASAQARRSRAAPSTCRSPIRRRCRSSRPARRRTTRLPRPRRGAPKATRRSRPRCRRRPITFAPRAHAPTPAGGRAWAADGFDAPRRGRQFEQAARVRMPRVLQSACGDLLDDRPAYITRMRSQNVDTRRRSCETKISPMPRSATSASRIDEHLQLNGDVERRRGLVGDQQVGTGDQHHRDHRALAHAARYLVRVEVEHAPGVVDAHRRRARPAPVAAPRAARRRGARCRVSTICSPIVITGFSENFGSCSTIAMRAAAQARGAALGGQRSRSIPANSSRFAVTRALGRRSPRIARPVWRLARARLADDAQPFATELEGDAAHGLGRAAVAIRERDAQVVDDEQRLHRGHGIAGTAACGHVSLLQPGAPMICAVDHNEPECPSDPRPSSSSAPAAPASWPRWQSSAGSRTSPCRWCASRAGHHRRRRKHDA